MSILKDLTGQRFGKLIVLGRCVNSKNKLTEWVCQCDCGNYCVVVNTYLTRGFTKSCGCLTNKYFYNFDLKIKKRLYNIWRSMKKRCNNPNDKSYKNYGGRGITYDLKWNKFINFYEWAVNNGYNNELSLDRINNDKNYTSENCRWVDMKTQQNNKRNNHLITYNGKTQTLTQWANELSINSNVISCRLFNGWNVEKALTTPVKQRGKKL